MPLRGEQIDVLTLPGTMATWVGLVERVRRILAVTDRE